MAKGSVHISNGSKHYKLKKLLISYRMNFLFLSKIKLKVFLSKLDHRFRIISFDKINLLLLFLILVVFQLLNFDFLSFLKSKIYLSFHLIFLIFVQQNFFMLGNGLEKIESCYSIMKDNSYPSHPTTFSDYLQSISSRRISTLNQLSLKL
jgi:hypothetical protein